MSQRDAGLIREVQAVRGLNMEEGSFLTRARRYTALLGPLVLLALRRVQLIANALDARGLRLRGSRHRLYRMPRWRGPEIGLVLVVMAVLALSIYLRVRGFGVVLPGRV